MGRCVLAFFQKHVVCSNLVEHQPFSNIARYTLALLDCSVWPSNLTYLSSAIQTFNACLSMSPSAGGFVYLPVPHSAISQEVLVKHRRKLEDGLMNGGMYVLNGVALQFVKQGSSQSDRRKTSQSALLVVASDNSSTGIWTTSHVWDRLLIQGIPLIRVSDMVGYDPESRPGAGARVEQILVFAFSLKVLSYWGFDHGK